MIPDIPIGNSGYNDILKAIFNENATQVLQVYPDERRSSIKQLQALTTDLYFVCPTRKIATSSSAIGNPTYLYVFTQIPSDDYIALFPLCNEGNWLILQIFLLGIDSNVVVYLGGGIQDHAILQNYLLYFILNTSIMPPGLWKKLPFHLILCNTGLHL
jgi:hypothetical protein